MRHHAQTRRGVRRERHDQAEKARRIVERITLMRMRLLRLGARSRSWSAALWLGFRRGPRRHCIRRGVLYGRRLRGALGLFFFLRGQVAWRSVRVERTTVKYFECGVLFTHGFE